MTSPNRNARSAVVVGRLLAAAFLICLFTGLYSHFLQQPYPWMHFPTRPVSLYKWSQGVHITAGIACFPLLLGKLYIAFPQLFQAPPVKSFPHLLERASIALFVASSLVQIFTGLLNTFQYYPWPFPFKQVHFALSFVIIGSLAVHIGVKLPLISRYWTRAASYDEHGDFITNDDDYIAPTKQRVATAALASMGVDRASLDDPGLVLPAEVERAAFDTRPPRGLVGRLFAWIDRTPDVDARTSRRGFFAAVGASTVAVVGLTAGQSFKPLDGLNVFAPRKMNYGPSGLPINRTAKAAQVLESAMAPTYLLTVAHGSTSSTFSVADLEAMEQHEVRLPIACVEGWSQMATWRGVRLVDLIGGVGASSSQGLQLTSLEKSGGYRVTMMGSEYAHDPLTLVALHLDGERLTIDHGYPARMIAPGRPGVLQTKWLSRIEVLR